MQIKSLLQKINPLFSFEFFPPKSEEGGVNLMETIQSLKKLSPHFISITYGAGGSTRGKTIELVARIKNEIGIETAAHLTCVGHTRDEIDNILSEFQKKGIENVIALRGDPPKGENQFTPNQEGYKYAAELVTAIRKKFSFSIGVAGYPEKHIEARSMDEDLSHTKEKVVAGADFIVTQLFFENRDYFRYVESLRKRNVNIPVIAGIMPITDYDQIKRFSTMCGAKLPGSLVSKLEGAKGDKEKVVEIGIDHAVQQCRDLLLNNVAGIHFYTLNRSRSTREIFERLQKLGVAR